MILFTEIEKKIPKINIAAQRPPNSQSNLEQKEQCWRYYNKLDFKLYYRA
jgi:hypothetical protein